MSLQSLPLRQKLLLAAAFVTAVATGYVASLPEDGAVASLAPAPVQARPAPNRAVDTARGVWPRPSDQALRAWGDPVGGAANAAPADAAPRVAAAAPRVVAAATPASAPPQAPPPPWKLVGRIVDEGRTQALLATPQRVLVVGEQQPIDADWRLERLGEQGAELLWLPGEQRVRLAWAAS
jgi:hypothetical protein